MLLWPFRLPLVRNAWGKHNKSQAGSPSDKAVQRMTNILRRKRKLILETPFLAGRRPMIVHVEPFGLRLRAKRSRHALEITWAQIFNRAAVIASERRGSKPKRTPAR